MQCKISEVLSYNFVQIYLREDELEKRKAKVTKINFFS